MGRVAELEPVLAAMPFDETGLLPAIAQQYDTGEVLMLAWMNREALRETLASAQACYYSRSRKQLWRKGERSGQTQSVKAVHLDCDGDAILLLVDQRGPACHTGRRSCFYLEVVDDAVRIAIPRIMDPDELYNRA